MHRKRSNCEMGFDSPFLVIGVVIAFALLYYSSTWLISWMREVKLERELRSGYLVEIPEDQSDEVTGRAYSIEMYR